MDRVLIDTTVLCADIHVMFGALEHDCNILLTANVDDFPKTFGNVEVVRPRAYYEYLTAKI